MIPADTTIERLARRGIVSTAVYYVDYFDRQTGEWRTWTGPYSRLASADAAVRGLREHGYTARVRRS